MRALEVRYGTREKRTDEEKEGNTVLYYSGTGVHDHRRGSESTPIPTFENVSFLSQRAKALSAKSSTPILGNIGGPLNASIFESDLQLATHKLQCGEASPVRSANWLAAYIQSNSQEQKWHRNEADDNASIMAAMLVLSC